MAFVPIGTTDGADWHGKLREGVILAAVADVFLGDMLTTATEGSDATGRAEAVTIATEGTGNALAGAVVEFTPDFTDEGSLTRNYHLTGADQRCKLVYGSDVIYEAPQVAGTVLTVAEINDNTNLDNTTTGGNTTTGISGDGIAGTASAVGDQFRLRGFTSTESDEASTAIGALGATWRVTINNSVDGHATGGV